LQSGGAVAKFRFVHQRHDARERATEHSYCSTLSSANANTTPGVSQMFEKIREMMRESQAMIPLGAEFKQVCPDAAERARLTSAFKEISRKVKCPHNESHILTFVIEMMRYCNDHSESEGVFVEAGCYKGGSTAKFSLVAKALDRKMVVFDSFEGIPENEEEHRKSIFGYSINDWFHAGAFRGGLEEVQHNVTSYGDIARCSFVKGWFDDTLPDISLDIAGAYIDVDLASSTRTCIQYFYPRLLPGGFLVSQDGDFPLVIEAFDDDKFWEEEVGHKKPKIHGLGTSKMLTVFREG
jgi:O-methyltransferase